MTPEEKQQQAINRFLSRKYGKNKKRGRPVKKIEPEFPKDGTEDMPPLVYEDMLGYNCENCLLLNRDPLTSEISCVAFTEYYFLWTLDDCPAKIDSVKELERLKQELEEYYNADPVTKSPEVRELERRIDHLNKRAYEGWQAGYYADQHRGKKGGGGEKEKAPNKARPKKPLKDGLSFIEEWKGF